MLHYLQNALRNIGRKRLRSVLTVLGIAIGVASVIIIGAIGQGGKQAVAAQLDNLGLNGLNIRPKTDSSIYNNSSMKDEDVRVCSSAAGVEEAMPLIMQMGISYMRGQSRDILVWGIGSNAGNIISLKLLHGRMFTEAQLKARDKVCLVDEDYAKAVYKRANITGKTITVFVGNGYQQLTVCGVVEQGSSLLTNLAGNYIPSFVYVPYTTAENLKGKSGYDQVAIKMSPYYNVDATGQRIVAQLSKLHGGRTFLADNMLKQKQRMNSLLDIVTLIITAVGAISLIVAGLSIMTVMTVSVNERTKEIGIKKAIGAKRITILTEFLFEALFISLFGAVFGIAAGAVCTTTASLALHFPLQLSAGTVLLAAGFASLIGIVFGVYPAVQAARLKPVDALRRE